MGPPKSATKLSLPESLTIGQVARQAGVGIQTIRFYERKGVLAEPKRRDSGYRQYPVEVVARLHFIKRAQDLGFSLREISELLALRVNPQGNCAAVKKRAESKLEQIESKITDLQRMRKILKEVTLACIASKPISDCPILKCFDKD